MSVRLIINRGDKFGKLTVIKEAEKKILPSGQPNRIILCKCDCGNKKEIRLLHLVRGRIRSCGCLPKVRVGKSQDPLCKRWRAIKYRCTPNYFEKHLYYDKGIRVCDEWLNSFDEFKKWSLSNGYKPELQIDRIDGSKGYSPDNCRWVTAIINANNRSDTIFVEYNGIKESLKLILVKQGKEFHYSAIRSRIKRGWFINDAINTPIKKGNYKTKEKNK